MDEVEVPNRRGRKPGVQQGREVREMERIMRPLILLAVLSLLTVGCAPKVSIERPLPCKPRYAEPTDRERLAALPQAANRAVDLAGDFILDHPVFERNFDVRYRAARDIPPSLDLERVELRQDRDG